MSEFYAPPVRDLGDPATDPPGTIRVEADPADQHARLFDRDARRAVRTTERGHWLAFAGATRQLAEWLTDDEVRTWPVVPAWATSSPWHLYAAAQPAPPTTAHERGDLDVEAFRG